jgi:hypothetical protein
VFQNENAIDAQAVFMKIFPVEINFDFNDRMQKILPLTRNEREKENL